VLGRRLGAAAVLALATAGCWSSRADDSDGSTHVDGSTDDAAAADDAAPPDDAGLSAMILIPAGSFLMGADDSACLTDQPLHEVWLNAYFIDRFEVTNGEYAACVDEGACAPPALPSSRRRDDYFGNAEFARYPVIMVRWENADAYCTWAGKRLPTEAEWEKAARGGCEIGGDPAACESGVDTRRYPWGDADPTCTLSNVLQECLGDTSAVGDFAGDISPYGVRDMLGNVREWTADFWDPHYYERSPRENPQGPTRDEVLGVCIFAVDGVCHTTRGYAFPTPPSLEEYLSLTCRTDSSPAQYVGFRCARNAP
jgi:formylglycine-generating enzyme required for sulfatase activity